jgi:hypothetical protein
MPDFEEICDLREKSQNLVGGNEKFEHSDYFLDNSMYEYNDIYPTIYM